MAELTAQTNSETLASTASQEMHPSMTMAQVLDRFSGARRALFRKYHIGGCSSCGFSLEETLGQVCERNGNLPTDQVIAQIKQSDLEDRRMQIGPRELQEALHSNAPPRLLDIRTREEWETVKLESSVLFTQEL